MDSEEKEKGRTGCKACKRREIKCDEAKPIECEGYRGKQPKQVWFNYTKSNFNELLKPTLDETSQYMSTVPVTSLDVLAEAIDQIETPQRLFSQSTQMPKNYIFVDEFNRHKPGKVTKACKSCQGRKIKCDGAKTSSWPCSTCIRLRTTCVPPSIDPHASTPQLQQYGGNVGEYLKYPLRPRRKKAKRSCSACIRGHLTCGDERPCQRCIERGLEDSCQDGVRKPEYLGVLLEVPSAVLDPNSNQVSNARRDSSNNNGPPTPSIASELNPTLPPHPQLSFESQQSLFGRQLTMQGFSVPQVSKDVQNSFEWAPFDSNPALFNFDLEGLNFGNPL